MTCAKSTRRVTSDPAPLNLSSCQLKLNIIEDNCITIITVLHCSSHFDPQLDPLMPSPPKACQTCHESNYPKHQAHEASETHWNAMNSTFWFRTCRSLQPASTDNVIQNHHKQLYHRFIPTRFLSLSSETSSFTQFSIVKVFFSIPTPL